MTTPPRNPSVELGELLDGELARRRASEWPSFMASTMVRAVAQRMVISPVWVQAAAP